MKELEEQYKSIVETLLNKSDISEIDQEIENANLLFGKSNYFRKSLLESNYVRILNRFDVSFLSEEEKEKMSSLFSIEEMKEFILSTINKVTNKNYYMEPLNKKIPKNTLVLEILVGPNTKEVKGQSFIDYMKLQEQFLRELKKKYTRKLTKKLDYPIIFYSNKEV